MVRFSRLAGVRLASLMIGVGMCLVALLLSAANFPIFTRALDAIHDAYAQAAPRTYDPQTPVHIIDIDDAALELYGQWPWPRSYMATLTDKLFQHGAIVVGFDVLFSSPDRTGAERADVPPLGSPAPLRTPETPAGETDLAFSEALKLGPTVLSLAGAQRGRLTPMKAGIAISGPVPEGLVQFPSMLVSQPVLSEAADGLGSVSFGRTSDGIIRALPAVTEIGGQLVPAFGLEVLRVAQGAGGYVLRTTDASGEVSGGRSDTVALKVGAAEVPLSPGGLLRLNYAGATPERLTSAGVVLQTDGIDPDLEAKIAGRIVLVGSSAPALFDIRNTPLGEQVAGVEIHAELIEQIIAGAYLNRPDWARGLEVVVVLLIGGLLTWTLVADRAVLALGCAILSGTGAVVASGWAYSAHGLLFDPIFPVLTAFLIALPGTGLGLYLKERARRRVRDRFAYFVPSAMVDDIADDPDTRLTPKGIDRELTVIFADLRGFTTITERMDPADVVRYVNAFLSTVSDTLTASGATIDKFMGDAVMAFWNAPLDRGTHREDALTAALQVETAIANLNATLPAQNLPKMDVAIGVNTGLAYVGLMGSKDRLTYTCVGDSVTLAARLEGLTRLYGVNNCVSASTLATMPETLCAIELDLIAVKGRAKAEPVFTVLPQGERTLTLSRQVASAREAFLARDWDSAATEFTSLGREQLAGRPLAPLADVYLSRIEGYRVSPPPADWDGRAEATSK